MGIADLKVCATGELQRLRGRCSEEVESQMRWMSGNARCFGSPQPAAACSLSMTGAVLVVGVGVLRCAQDDKGVMLVDKGAPLPKQGRCEAAGWG